jgi:hypothetical protein
METAGASSAVTALVRRSRAAVRRERQRAGAALARHGERLRERNGVAADALRYLDELRDAADALGGGSLDGAAGIRSADGADRGRLGERQLEAVGAGADRDRGGGGP